MKKRFIPFFAVAAFSFLIWSCGEKTSSNSADTSSDEDWAMMDEFHVVMAESFHPYKDSANVQPAKDNAGEMFSVADRWAEAKLPARVDNEDVKAKIVALRDNAKSFQETVRTGTDQQIGEELNVLHDQFHELQDAWYHSGSGDGHDHSGHQH